ncbi:MAG: hypothetical protein VZR73_01330 [Acutalibacteraceae bacterium]|nr:hypothetical protein [Acutalibacteraceae bacterium]
MKLSDLPDNEKIMATLRDMIITMGFSYAVIDTKFTIGLYYWHDSPEPTTIYGAIIEREEGLSGYLGMGWVEHLNTQFKRCPSCGCVGGIKADCSEQELKAELDKFISFLQQEFRPQSDAYYGVTSFYDDPKDVITEMTENHHGTVIDFYYQS